MAWQTISIFLTIWLLLLSSQSKSETETANCQSINKQLALEADARMYSPTAFARSEIRSPDKDYGSDNQFTGKQLQFGLELGIQKLWQGMLKKDLLDIECERAVYLRQIKDLAIDRQDSIAPSRLEAELKVLKESLSVYQDDYSVAKQRFANRIIGVQDLDNAAQYYQKLQAEIHSKEFLFKQQTQLAATRPIDTSQSKLKPQELLSKYYDTELQRLSLQRSLSWARSWEVNLAAGRSQFQYQEHSKGANFASLELKFNLGANETGAEYASALSENTRSFIQDSVPTAELLETKREYIKAMMTDLQERETMLQPYADKYVSSSVDTRTPILKDMHWRWLLVKSELVGLTEEYRFISGGQEIAAVNTKPAESKPSSNSNVRLNTMKTNMPNFRWHRQAINVDVAEFEFQVTGEPQNKRALKGGETRRQLGLMLRHENQCNLIYAMWRIDDRKIFVQEKTNPGQSTHEQCENKGYHTVSPVKAETLGNLEFNHWYRLKATIAPNMMQVYLDDKLVWQGKAPTRIRSGKDVGFRSDNLDVEYRLISDDEKSKG